MSAQRVLDDDVADTVKALMESFDLLEKSGTKTDNTADGTGLNDSDDKVVSELIKYKHYITDKGVFPGKLSLEGLQNVPYDPDSDYAKRSKVKKETYFAKFLIEYKLPDIVESKQVGIGGAFLDLMARPEMYNSKVNGFSKEYVAVYISAHVVDRYKSLIEKAGYKMDSAGVNIDKGQALVAFNANYSTQNVPRLTIHRALTEQDDEGNDVDKRILDTSHTIETMYTAARGSGGVIFRGFAFGEFGVSKQVPIGAPPPPAGSTLKLTFKLLGFHAFSRSETVRAIKSKSSKSNYGI